MTYNIRFILGNGHHLHYVQWPVCPRIGEKVRIRTTFNEDFREECRVLDVVLATEEPIGDRAAVTVIVERGKVYKTGSP